MRCIYCDKEIDCYSFKNIFIKDDELCYECRAKLVVNRKITKIDGLKIETFFEYEGMYRDLLIQYKECYDEALKNVFLYDIEDYLKINPFNLKPIPFIKDGFYYQSSDIPSKHPYYYAGLYYLQEPSAMLPAEVLPIEQGDIVLDACAAPGGKTSKLANKLDNSGTLYANDISVSRAQVLLKTLESFGTKNAYVMAQDIHSLVERFENYFDKILVDAPCSGEGMFRKEPELIKSWLEKGNDYYANIQKQIIIDALKMLKEGGQMVYSTCTFNSKEDEEIIEYAISIYPELKVLPINNYEGFESGLTEKTKNCVRLYPHKINGEGHFVCLLQKGEKQEKKQFVNNNVESILPKDFLLKFNNGDFVKRDNKLYFEPSTSINLNGLRILRSGLYLGEYRHDKFEPSQALAMALKKDEYQNILNFDSNDNRVLKYLKCETLDVKDKYLDGLVLVCVDNYPLGFGVINKGILKNKLPANYRYL